MNIQFDEIPASLRTPGAYAEFNSRLAASSLPTNRQRVRLVGQRIATTSPVAANNVPVNTFSEAEVATIFGAGSQLHVMARAAFKANRYVQLCCVAVADPAGTAAAGLVVMSGTATVGGVASLGCGADAVSVSVAVGDTAQTVLSALAAALAQRPELPVTGSTAVAGQLALTAKNVGAAGNDIKIALRFTRVAGLTRTVTQMQGGAGAPDLVSPLSAVFTAGDDVLVMPYRDSTSLTALRSHLTAAGGGLEMRGAVACLGHTGSYGDVVAMAASVNSERMVPVWLRGTSSIAWEVGAAMAAVAAGVEDPARPLNNRVLNGIAPPAEDVRATGTETEACLYNGVTPLKVGPGERVQVVRAVTSYTLNTAGVEDPAWLDITSIRTMDYVRRAWRQRMLLRFPDDKMVLRTIRAVRSETIDVLMRCEELEILHNVRALLDRIVVEPHPQQAGTLVVRVPCNVVPGLHVIAAVFDLIL